jgi:hypothetical protein
MVSFIDSSCAKYCEGRPIERVVPTLVLAQHYFSGAELFRDRHAGTERLVERLHQKRCRTRVYRPTAAYYLRDSSRDEGSGDAVTIREWTIGTLRARTGRQDNQSSLSERCARELYGTQQLDFTVLLVSTKDQSRSVGIDESVASEMK